jgi:hypothetical protein
MNSFIGFDPNARVGVVVLSDAVAHDYQALVRLAGILAHERWHLTHGHDEVGAYTVSAVHHGALARQHDPPR